MSKLCRCGSGREKKGYGKFNFTHKGFTFVAVRMGLECDDCSFDRECTITAFDEYGEKLISEKRYFFGISRDLVINWDFYCKFMEERSGQDDQSLNNILVALGIFSVNLENNWVIADGLIDINPRWHSSPLYFTRESDVLKYARLKLSNVLYFWEIRHIAKVIKKSDVE